MKVEATAKSHFVHGNQHFAEGDKGQFTKAEASDLEKSGLITVGDDVSEEDLLGDGEKQAPAVENKMEKPVANKAVKK